MRTSYFPFATVLILLESFSLGRDVTLEIGHMKPFGFGKSTLLVKEVEGFPDANTFFRDFAMDRKPIKMNNAAKYSPAFAIWTDDYFLGIDEPPDSFVSVETMKKEDRGQTVRQMTFGQFVSSYNNSDIYMVNPVPKFIRQDVVMPCIIQCKGLLERKLVESVMWFSSGGTKSVVHTDSVDNVNCLYRGDKQFIMVDPEIYGDKVDLDHPEGSYSDVDVDRADFNKYPGLADVEYYSVNLTAGDCLFIPYKWIHQVRSFGSNLAVNIWWNHEYGKEFPEDTCNSECDPSLTLATADFTGFSQVIESIEAIKDHFQGHLLVSKKFNYSKFEQNLIGQDKLFLEEHGVTFDHIPKKIFSVLDLDNDNIVTLEEMRNLENEDWMVIQKEMSTLEQLLLNVEKSDRGEFRFTDEL